MDFLKLVFMAIFIRPRLYWIPAAMPFLRLGETTFPKSIALMRLTGMHAGVLHDWQTRLSRSNQRRSEITASVSRDLSLMPRGRMQPYVRLPIFVASPQGRKQIHSFARQRGLGVSLAYPTPINEIPEIRHLFDGQRFPSARNVADHILTIPTHQWISEEDRRAIVECVAPPAGAGQPAGRMAASRVSLLQ